MYQAHSLPFLFFFSIFFVERFIKPPPRAFDPSVFFGETCMGFLTNLMGNLWSHMELLKLIYVFYDGFAVPPLISIAKYDRMG